MADDTTTDSTATDTTVTDPAAKPGEKSTPESKTATTIEVDGKQVDVSKLLEENARYQREAENARVAAKATVAKDAQKKQLLAVAEIAGIKIEDPEKETVETLTAKVAGNATQAQQSTVETDQAKRDAAFATGAWNAGAPADKATYLKFLASQDAELAKLDPSAADYQTSVNARIKALVDGDPIFKATPGGAGRSGAEDFGGAGANGTVTQEVFDKMTIQEQTKLYQTNPDLFRRLSGI